MNAFIKINLDERKPHGDDEQEKLYGSVEIMSQDRTTSRHVKFAESEPIKEILEKKEAKPLDGFSNVWDYANFEQILNENNIDQDLDKETLTKYAFMFLKKSSFSITDLNELILKGARRNGFNFIKPITVAKLVDILEGDFIIEDSWNNDPRRRDRRLKLRRIFRIVFILRTMILRASDRFKKMEPNSSKPEKKEIKEEIDLGRPKGKEYTVKQTLRIYYGIFVVFCGILFMVGWVVQIYSQPGYYNYIGPWIGFSKGSAYALLILSICALIFMYRDLITLFRRTRLGIFLTVLLNEHIHFHKICGATAFFFGCTHTIGHLCGTYRVFSGARSVDDINKALTNARFDRIYTYSELLFNSTPGITGILLLVIMLLMGVTSTEYIRNKYFRLFSFTHMLYIFYIILIYIHGCGFWFNYGWPFSAPFITLPVFITLLHHARKWWQKRDRSDIIDVSFSSKSTVAFIKIRKPQNFHILPGQYLFLNLPDIFPFEWHPFSICSTGQDGTLKLMIKNAGDFTGVLLSLLFTSKSEFIFYTKPELSDHKHYQKLYYEWLLKEEDVLKVLMDDRMHRERVPKYPKISLYGPISAPAVGSLFQKHIIFIGAGVGISPYLIFLEEYIYYLRSHSSVRKTSVKKMNVDKEIQRLIVRKEDGISFRQSIVPTAAEVRYLPGIPSRQDLCIVDNFFNSFESMTIYYIARDSDQLSWISGYIQKLIKYGYSANKLDLKLFLTLPKEVDSFDSFLFWRAFNKYNKIKKVTRLGFSLDILTNLPMQIIFSRPNFDELILQKAKEKSGSRIAVYACAPQNLLTSIEAAVENAKKNTSTSLTFFPEKF